MQPAKAPFQGYKQSLNDGSGTGWCHRTLVRDGFSVVSADIAYNQISEEEHAGVDAVKFHFKLSGHSGVIFERGDYTPLENGQVLVLVQPQDSIKCERVEADAHQRCVTLTCERDFAANVLPMAGGELPKSVSDFLQRRTPWFSIDRFPLTPQMRILVEDLLIPPACDALHQLTVEAKALELICETVRQMGRVPTPYANLSSRDIRKVRDMCALLSEERGPQLSIAELARLFAWNEAQMMASFKQVTGTTISAYRRRNTLEAARRQLVESEASISEIAFDAGYEYQANFATAFKREFGYSPSTLRMRPN